MMGLLVLGYAACMSIIRILYVLLFLSGVFYLREARIIEFEIG